MKRVFTVLLLVVLLGGCGEKMEQGEVIQIGITSCRKLAPFIRRLGFDGNRSALSSNVASEKGIVLVQFPDNPADTVFARVWRDSTWSDFGYMGAITTDNKGNAYSATVPRINTLDVPLSQMNRVVKIDSETGKMTVFSELPAADTSRGVVPFAVLGVYYDCHGDKLYASSVAGSTREDIKGVIYVIDPQSGKVLDEMEGYDAMGVFVGGITGEKRLFFGDARSSSVKSVELTKTGEFTGKVRDEFTLDNLGPRGSDKARRIRLEPNGTMVVFGVEFNYSLAAHTEKPETPYLFQYDRAAKAWTHLK